MDHSTKLNNRETRVRSTLRQTLVGRDERSAFRLFMAPNQGGRKLKAVSCPQFKSVQEASCKVTQRVRWQDFPPASTENVETGQGTLLIRVLNIPSRCNRVTALCSSTLLAHQTTGRNFPQVGLRLTAGDFVDTQRDQGACTPKRRLLVQKLCARSSRSAWTASLSDTLPVRISRSPLRSAALSASASSPKRPAGVPPRSPLQRKMGPVSPPAGFGRGSRFLRPLLQMQVLAQLVLVFGDIDAAHSPSPFTAI